MENVVKVDNEVYKKAVSIHNEIIKLRSVVGFCVVEIGKKLKLINEGKYYIYFDCDTFDEYISLPEVNLGRSTARYYLQITDMIDKSVITANDVVDVGWSNLKDVLPAIKKLSDNNNLSKIKEIVSDLKTMPTREAKLKAQEIKILDDKLKVQPLTKLIGHLELDGWECKKKVMKECPDSSKIICQEPYNCIHKGDKVWVKIKY